MTIQNRNIVRIALATGLLLLVPLIAMQFTSEVNWSAGDFVFAGILLFGAGLTYELLVARRGSNTAYRVAVGLAVGASLFLVWSNAAVGLIGSEDNPINLLYGAVLAIGFLGAIAARLRSRGMAWVMFGMASAQAAILMIALVLRNAGVWPDYADWSLVPVIGINAFFVVLFVGSALLFRQAGEAEPEAEPEADQG